MEPDAFAKANADINLLLRPVGYPHACHGTGDWVKIIVGSASVTWKF